MNGRELTVLFRLRDEIEKAVEQAERLEASIKASTPAYSPAPVNNGAERGRPEAIAVCLADLYAMIKEKQEQTDLEREKLNRYISSFPDPVIRTAFRARFIELLSWEAVAERVGHGYTANAIRMKCRREVYKRNSGGKWE